MQENREGTPANETWHEDAASIVSSIKSDQATAMGALSVDSGQLYASWGLAWILGFLALFFAHFPLGQPVLALVAAVVIAASLCFVAVVFAAVHIRRRRSGAMGISALRGWVFGASFATAFAFVGALGSQLTDLGVTPDAMLTYWVAASCLIISIFYALGSVLWNDRSHLIFASWTAVIGFASIFVPAPWSLICGVVGGIGFLSLAFLTMWRPHVFSGTILEERDE